MRNNGSFEQCIGEIELRVVRMPLEERTKYYKILLLAPKLNSIYGENMANRIRNYLSRKIRSPRRH